MRAAPSSQRALGSTFASASFTAVNEATLTEPRYATTLH